MQTTTKSLMELTAGDLMMTDVARLTDTMPLREAARLLLHTQISGAPVVNALGKCVGVFSTTDFLRLALKRADPTTPLPSPLSITCPFQVKQRIWDGHEANLCALPPGVCPLQVKQQGPHGGEMLVCSQPHCVIADWQVVDLEELPTDEVRHYMTADPVTVDADTPLRVLARRMIDAHIHRLIVVDERQRPIGVVASTDILAAVAYSDPDS
jgi:CBS domain-containing protein